MSFSGDTPAELNKNQESGAAILLMKDAALDFAAVQIIFVTG